jgi:hypothetical protein
MNERLNIHNWFDGGVSNPTLDDYVAEITGLDEIYELEREFVSNPKNRSKSIPNSQIETGQIYEVQAKIDGVKHREYYLVTQCEKTENIFTTSYDVSAVIRHLGGKEHVKELLQNTGDIRRMITEDALCRRQL